MRRGGQEGSSRDGFATIGPFEPRNEPSCNVDALRRLVEEDFPRKEGGVRLADADWNTLCSDRYLSRSTQRRLSTELLLRTVFKRPKHFELLGLAG